VSGVTTFQPTAEQQNCLDLFATGENLVIEAGAGTGKSSTLRLLAEARPDLRFLYCAFNKAIVTDAKASMPRNVECRTAHSLAYGFVAGQYPGMKRRLDARRLPSQVLAKALRVDPITIKFGTDVRTLSAGFLASTVMQGIGRFCQTADPTPAVRHLPYLEGIDLPTPDGERTYDNNDMVRRALVPALQRAWTDIADPDGPLDIPFNHDCYLKLWQLAGPRLSADVILFDEAQDANPVMAAVVAAQDHAQLIYVGDSQQAIYEFTGAVNAMAEHSGARTYLTQSFRFGPAVAQVANVVLGLIPGAVLRLKGTESIPSTVGPVRRPDAILCRTNAGAVRELLVGLKDGRRCHLVGGTGEIASFCRAAQALDAGMATDHPVLSMFSTWDAVVQYVEEDPLGSDLKMLVTLIDEFGAVDLLAALNRCVKEEQADLVISTAHKSKGREWDAVLLAGDFQPPKDREGQPRDPSPAELRLLYVAVTRARRALDHSACPIIPAAVAA
jgi:hypothetical protein